MLLKTGVAIGVMASILVPHAVEPVVAADAVRAGEGLTQVGKARFRIPTGWKRLDQGALTVLVPPDVTEESRLILAVIPGQEFQGEFRQAFEATLRGGLKETEKLVQEGEVQSRRSPQGYDMLLRAMVVENKDGTNRTFRVFIGAKVNNRLEIATLFATKKELFDQYQPAIDQFLDSWSFTDLPVKPGAAPPRPAVPVKPGTAPKSGLAIQGLYVANILQNRPRSFGGGYEYANFNEFWLLLPGGRVYFGLPEGGLDTFDWEKVKAATPNKCAAYQVVGGKVRFEWRGKPVEFAEGQETVKLPAAFSGQSGPTFFKRVTPGNDVRLNGTFTRRSFTSVSSNTTEGGVGGETRYSFTPDGRFQVSGFTGFTATSNNGGGGATGSSRREGAGTYRVRGYTLELSFADGGKVEVLFFRFPGEEEAVISLNGANYLRAK